MDEIEHLDLFGGIAGFSLALRNIYPGKIKTSYSEIDKYASKIFKKHFPEAKELGDITTIRGRKIGKYNLVTFGFPCQDLSIAGRRLGIQGGRRSSLFFEAIRIINKSRPEYFIAENVKGFFSSHDGKDFVLALKTITDIGYDCQWQLINTKWFLPQNRERIFIVGHLRGQPRPEIFPIQESYQDSTYPDKIWETENSYAGCINTKNNSPQWQFDSSTTLILDRKGIRKNKNIASTLTGTEKSGGNHSDMDLIQVGNIDQAGHNSIWGRVYDPDGIATTINAEGGGLGAKTGLYVVGYTRDKDGKRTDHLKEEFGAIKSTSGATSNQSEYIYSNSGIRRLTPVECERLQGFPDGWTDGISDTQRYKCLGNAITVNVVEEILKRLYVGDK